MNRRNEQLALTRGMDVVASDGDKLGEIVDVSADQFLVKKGWLLQQNVSIPMSAVASVEANTVYLGVTLGEAMSEDRGGAQQSAGMSATEVSAGNAATTAGRMEMDPQPFEHEQDSTRTHVNEDDNLRIDVAEEELTATKHEVDRGDVILHKDVVTDEQQLDVPVTEEQVNVTRRKVDRDAPPDHDDAFIEESIDVPLHGEEVDVEKRTRIAEEVDIDTEAVHGTERVTDTVRHDEVTVDGERIRRASDQDKDGGTDERRRR